MDFTKKAEHDYTCPHCGKNIDVEIKVVGKINMGISSTVRSKRF